MSASQIAKPGRTVNSSPLFDTQGSWSSGYALATAQGPGAVVGPGAENPNVFAQTFPAGSWKQFELVARAASANAPKASGVLQVNWHNKDGKLISVFRESFKVSSTERVVRQTLSTPSGATHGTLYVVPAGPNDVVRYTEMTLNGLEPLGDFLAYRFWGIKGSDALLSAAMVLLGTFLIARFKTQIGRCWPSLFELVAAGGPRAFSLLCLTACGAAFWALETAYELHIDAHWHQAQVEAMMRWNDFSLDLVAAPLYNFGIQLPINPKLSPAFWAGTLVSANHRIQIEGAVQAIFIFLILLQICRSAGAGVFDASAVAMISTYFLCVPYLTSGAIPSNAVLGLLWQEGTIATLATFGVFVRIGDRERSRTKQLFLLSLLIAMSLWLFLAYLELVVFFAISAAGLCAGAMVGVGRKELVQKLSAVTLLLIVLLALGMHRFAVDLFQYTPQMYFATLMSDASYSSYFVQTSLFTRHLDDGWHRIQLFYGLSILGGVLTLKFFPTSVARKVVFGALGLEVSLLALSCANWTFQVVPLNFYYAELMGIGVVALLASTAIWCAARAVSQKVSRGIYSLVTRTSTKDTKLAPSILDRWVLLATYATPAIILIAATTMVLRASKQPPHFSVWPPRAHSIPAQTQIAELATAPGDRFRGRGAVLVGMDWPAATRWPVFVDIISTHYRQALGNDLFLDAMAFGVPMVNEYGHWTSPSMLALLTAAFYHPQDHIGRAALAPRAYRANLARLLGVSLVVSDKSLPGEAELYKGTALGHPVHVHRIADANIGQYSPTKVALASNATQILDYIQTPDFDGRKLAIVESTLDKDLVQAQDVVLTLRKGPRIHVEARSAGTSLLVLPFDFSHCLQVEGQGFEKLFPVNLAQIGLVFQGQLSVDISFRYGPIHGTSCRRQDLERIRQLQLEKAATGRLFFDARSTQER
jgi:hypothetical protein